MTAPRTGLFQRKGAPSSSNLTAGKPGATDLDSGPGPVTKGEDSDGAEPVTCPQCGCQFDASDPSVQGDGQATSQDQATPMDDGAGGDLGAKIAAMMGGGPQ